MPRLTAAFAIAAIAIQFVWVPMPVCAQVLVLVSDAEVAADRADAPIATRGIVPGRGPSASPGPDAPRIDVLLPEIVGRPLVAPFPISLRFVAAAGREIVPTTLKIFYGRLGLDVTSRILAATSVTQQGLDVPSARVPKGSHQLLLEIRDDAGNVGRSGLVFEVGD